jgi:hypothetical protein
MCVYNYVYPLCGYKILSTVWYQKHYPELNNCKKSVMTEKKQHGDSCDGRILTHNDLESHGFCLPPTSHHIVIILEDVTRNLA